MNTSIANSAENTLILQTILSSPGMGEKCKIVLNISRQNVLAPLLYFECWFIRRIN